MRSGERQRGFTYLGLLFLVALIALGLAKAGQVASTSIRHDKETELLFVGAQYREAIARFVHAQHRYPQSLQELIGVDTGGSTPARYLRRLYPDPMNPGGEWTVIPAQQGGVQGVASAAHGRPLKQAGFSEDEPAFEDADSYAQWAFVYVPRRDNVGARGTQAAPIRR